MRCSRSLSPLALAAMLLAAALPASPAGAQRGQPPHAWLFGAWTGGLFPVAPQLSTEACRSQPSVVFGQDVVARSSLIQPGMVRRVIETASTARGRVEFRFVPAGDNTSSNVLGQPDAAVSGFGCESPDVLHVQRMGPNEITFPGCKDFPNPLVRCPSS